MPENILSKFRPQVAGWFADVFAAPTPVQQQAWEAISAGKHALVVAPTGSGKTLAAFLWALNALVEREGQMALPVGAQGHTQGQSQGQGASAGVKVLYISPLKALGVDVENNLRAPLAGIARVAQRLGLEEPNISVGVRSGDTPQAERNRQLRRPPDVLITTPESAYLMLTSKASGILQTVDTVIIDEIHAVAGTKRGVHLALTLERLTQVAGEFQRIGLSATVRPVETVAHFLGGTRSVEIIAPPGDKHWDLGVHVPVEDMSDLPVPEPGSTIGELTIDDQAGITASDSALPTAKSIWPHIEQELYAEAMAHTSTLVFVNSRRTAERVTSRLNELYAQEHDPDALAPTTRRDPAQLMKQVDVAGTAPALIARAHHGSVSKDERALTERMLKEGSLRAVVATSSLELGIDMGAVDLVVQVESPPAVASGLQRVGRAGHSVGAVSQGSFYPKHRADLLQTAVTVERMRAGQIEQLRVPSNPLDVLAQHTVAAVAAAQTLDVEQWYATVTRAWPYRDLAREVFDAVIDLVSGVYPSTDFAELRPRVVFDRLSGQLTARPGAQRVAVTNGGTIPDRGMFGVFLVGGSDAPRRVGELDEEMVYESRVGDVFTLGASSWRIEDITRDQVLVSPAPGHTGRLPFWNGDQPGRPYELGKALGAFRREVHAQPQRVPQELDARARRNLLAYLEEQQEATGLVPDEKTLLLERFTDELGDWRVVLHTPFGRPVNAAWALAVGHRVATLTGMDPQAVAGDDGIVLRIPEGESVPDAGLFLFEADEIAQIVTEQVGNSALFASRFRECAARALLLPRHNPGKRAPLWQQRQRAEQLLDVARKYPSFPIILETVRECVQDVYDLPALQETMRDLAQRRIRIAEVTTQQPSPFASSLLFNYTGAFMYEGDSPLAEKRAAALALDPALLAKLLGTVELRELLDPDIIADVHAQLQWLTPQRRARSAEQVADLLRVVGPVPVAQLGEHAEVPLSAVESLGKRIMRVRIGGVEHLAQALDAPLLRDGLGVPVPPGIAAQQATITDALAQLVSRWARTRGPFTVPELADALGLSPSAAHTVLASLDGLVQGHYRQGVAEEEYVAAEVLRTIRSRSLAAARAATEPVSAATFGRFLPQWQQVGGQLAGVDGVFAVIEQLAGVRLPASAWESLVLPARVANYHPTMLDELTANGEVLIVGAGKAAANDPWIMLLPTEDAPDLVPQANSEGLTVVQTQLLEAFRGGGSFLVAEVAGRVAATSVELREALWGLVEAGLVSPDSFAPIRAHLATTGRPTHSRRGRSGRLAPDLAGRWGLTVAPGDVTSRSVTLGQRWLERYGVLTRGSVVAEDTVGGFALAYKVLSGFEESGKAIRGYVIEGLGAAQFSTPAVIDRLRGLADSPDVHGWPSGATTVETHVLAAADPANPYGAALSWPEGDGDAARPSRAAGALVVLMDGLPVAHLTRGGKTLTTFFAALPAGIDQQEVVAGIVDGLRQAVTADRLAPLVIEKANGQPIFGTELAKQLRAAGLGITPKGVRVSQNVVNTAVNTAVNTGVSKESHARGRFRPSAIPET
ncbi:ATP-dependent helicase [Corynebacterium lizhenjunii]|uniref:ATP-dependent helicase n=1 Tax=Corynebacterium lizhenjunii TaxID=2709394 RepID=UPI0013EB7680|nr:ATP-dependent helicase [Corynebacterium lizhenjunii]